MFRKQYLRHMLLMIVLLLSSLFLFFIFFWNIELIQLLLLLPLGLIFFRRFYQTIIVSILGSVLTLFLKTKITIQKRGTNDYMIVKTFVKKLKPFFYMNKAIDWLLNKIIKMSLNNALQGFQTLSKDHFHATSKGTYLGY